MERFLEITVLTDKSVANRCCEALEDALIPLMLQHVELRGQRSPQSGYRLLVPTQFSQRARRITDLAQGAARGSVQQGGMIEAGGFQAAQNPP